MRHRVFGNQLGRNTKQAKALYQGLVAALRRHGKITTTLAKAKAIRGLVNARIVKLGPRFSDAAEMVRLEIVDQNDNSKSKNI